VVACAAGCSSATDDEGAGGAAKPASDAQEAASAAQEASRAAPDDARPFYATVARDGRRCPAPCVIVSAVGEEGRSLRASELDLRAAGLDAEAVFAVRSADDGDLVVYGRMGPRGAKGGERPFVVAAAYRGMPGVHARRGDGLFVAIAADERAAAADRAAPGEPAGSRGLRARRIDGGATRLVPVASVDVGAAARTGVDAAWLEDRFVARGAIVAARVTRASRLEVSQVLVRLPDVVGPCPRLAIRCAGGTVATYERSAQRCLVSTGCAARGVCPYAVPACDDGYTSVSWPAAPGACPRFACEPAFLGGSPPVHDARSPPPAPDRS